MKRAEPSMANLPMVNEVMRIIEEEGSNLLCVKAAIHVLIDNTERMRDRLDHAEGVLASVTDALNTYSRESNVEETADHLSLAVRDGLDRLVFALRQREERALGRAIGGGPYAAHPPWDFEANYEPVEESDGR